MAVRALLILRLPPLRAAGGRRWIARRHAAAEFHAVHGRIGERQVHELARSRRSRPDMKSVRGFPGALPSNPARPVRPNKPSQPQS